MGIVGRGRIEYINWKKRHINEEDLLWNQWYLEDNQMNILIINSISNEIQLLILRKKTVWEIWVVLEQMYETKKKDVHVYRLMNDIYSIRQEKKSVSGFYQILKAKWKDFDYHTEEK